MAYLKAGLLLLAGAVVVGMAAEAAGAHPTPAGSRWQWLGPVSAGLGLFSFAAGGVFAKWWMPQTLRPRWACRREGSTPEQEGMQAREMQNWSNRCLFAGAAAEGTGA